jgi:hypothetical protein
MKAIQAKADANQKLLQEMMRINQKRIESKMDVTQEKKVANLREVIVQMKDR